MPPRNASYLAGPCGGGRGLQRDLCNPLPPPGGRRGGASRGSQPGGISADHVKAVDFQAFGQPSAFPTIIGVQIECNATIPFEICTVPRGQIINPQLPDVDVRSVLASSTIIDRAIKPNQTAAAIFLPILVILLYQYVWVFLKKGISTKTTSCQLIKEIKDILCPRSADVAALLKERAEANQRLVRALHISNTFVSADLDVHKVFVAQVRLLMNATQRHGWAHFQAIVIDAVQWQLSQHDQDPFRSKQTPFKFDSFVQNITLVVVLVGILQVDKPVQSFSHEDVALVANRITSLWALSKKSDPIPPALLEELTTHLRRLVVDEVQFPNPVDFVIPAWETLWRVVATTIAYSYSDKEIRKAFEEFNVCPSDVSFRGEQASEMDVSVSVKAVVSEVMRLHPPSKRIGRSKSRMWWPRFLETWIQPSIATVTRRADVEKLLRCDIWGTDANEFRPSRHSPHLILPEQTEALAFGFGYGPFRCIAASWAPMAAGVISGAILKELDTSGYVLNAGAVIGGREGWNDWVIETE